MTTIPTTHRPLAWRLPTVIVVVLIGVLIASGGRLTWDRPTFTDQAGQARPGITTASLQRVQPLTAARHELRALHGVVSQVPTLRQSLHDDIQLLTAVSAGLVPVDALQSQDDIRLQRAINTGQVPPEALEPWN